MNSKLIGRVFKENVLFLNCDIQSIFRDLVYKQKNVIQVGKMMANISNILKIPTLITEHNKRIFRETEPEIIKIFNGKNSLIADKSTFSMINDETQKNFLDKHPLRKQAILYGIEAHVCVQQTALTLLEKNYEVHLLVDGISSQNKLDRKIALKRMEKAGAYLTTSESIIFEIMKNYEIPEFKQILAIIKTNDRSDSF